MSSKTPWRRVPSQQFTTASPSFSPGTLTTYLIVRCAPDTLGLAAGIRDQIWSVDRDQPVSVLPMDQIVSGSLERRRFVLMLLGTFAALALLLSVVGIYGVIAYSVGQRTHEFGIRMALGAQRHRLLLMVLSQSVWILAVGLTIGVAGALTVTRLMGSLLFGIGPADPLNLSLMAAILLAVALIAVPARRAMKVDPMVALRDE
jgi:putative ABC transport system permease protein